MTKSNYNSEFEDSRRAIELEENTIDELPSRVDRHKNYNKSSKGKKKKSSKNFTLINVILVLFTLIPIGIFMYVLSDLYNPKDGSTVSVDKSDVSIEVGPNKSLETTDDITSGLKDESDSEVQKPEVTPKLDSKSESRTHTVAPSETLYLISVDFYGFGGGVEKIKAANGLSSNLINVGQTLVIP